MKTIKILFFLITVAIAISLLAGCEGDTGPAGPQGSQGDSPFINVYDFGAVGDGLADDTEALSSALTEGGDVYFPPGTYRVVSSLEVFSETMLRGAGAGQSVIFQAVSDGGATLELNGDHIIISDLSVVGPNTTNDVYIAGETGIQASAPDGERFQHIQIRDSEVIGFGSHGIRLHRVDDVIVSGNHVYRIGFAGIACLSCFDVRVDNNLVESVKPGSPSAQNAYGIIFSYQGGQPTLDDPPPQRCIAHTNTVRDVPSWEGLDTHDGCFITFSNNIVEGCRLGIHAGGTAGGAAVGVTMHDISIVGNTLVASGDIQHLHYGISATGYDGHLAYNIAVADNIIQGFGTLHPNATSGAVEIYYTRGVAVSGNVLKNYANCAIMFYRDNTSFICSGNIIDSDGTPGGEGVCYSVWAKENENWGLISGNQTSGVPILVADPSRVIVVGNN